MKIPTGTATSSGGIAPDQVPRNETRETGGTGGPWSLDGQLS